MTDEANKHAHSQTPIELYEHFEEKKMQKQQHSSMEIIVLINIEQSSLVFLPALVVIVRCTVGLVY